MRSRDSGAATAELAILLPAIVGLIVLVFSVVSVQLQLLQEAAQVANLSRAVELGRNPQQIQELAKKFSLGLEISQSGDLTCLSASKPVLVLGANLTDFVQKVCALAPGK